MSLFWSRSTILVSEYNFYIRAAEDILGGPQIEHTSARIAALDIFLHREGKAKEILSKLKKAIGKERVALEARQKLLDWFLQFLESVPQVDEQGIQIVEDIAKSIDPQNLYLKRIVEVREANFARKEASSWLSLFGWSTKSDDAKSLLSIPAHQENKIAEEYGKGLLAFAKNIRSQSLQTKTREFLAAIRPQPYRIVLVGEIKHGKSTLFNAIMGKEFSPVGESTATTTATIELAYAPDFQYKGEWLSDEYIDKIKSYIAEHKEEPQLMRYLHSLEKITSAEYFSPGKEIKEISCFDEIRDYISTEGEFYYGVKSIQVGWRIPELQSGAVIVDTPGINDPMHVRDYITLGEAKKADCILFVMNAGQLGKKSEKAFLRSLVTIGKAVSLIVVVTHSDKISSTEGISEKIRQWLDDCFANQDIPQGIKEPPIFPINTPEAMKHRIQNIGAKYKPENDKTGFAELWGKIAEIAQNRERNKDYIELLRRKKQEIAAFARQEFAKYTEAYQQDLPTEQSIANLRELEEKLQKLSESYIQQMKTRLLSVKERLEKSARQAVEDVEQVKQTIYLKAKGNIEERISKLGEEYADTKKWESFDELEMKDIIAKHSKNLENRLQEELAMHERDLQLFLGEIEEQNSAYITNLVTYRSQNVSFQQSSRIRYLMCKVDRYAKQVESTVKSFTAGIAVGGGIGQLFVIGGVLFHFPVAIFALAGTWAIWKKFSDEESRKDNFVKNKLEKIQQGLEKEFANFTQGYEARLQQIGDQFLKVAREKCQPLLAEVISSQRETEYQRKIASTLSEDGTRYLEHKKEELDRCIESYI